MEKQFTIGYIRHDESVFNRLLKPSIENLKGAFDVVSVSDENNPAQNYNDLIKLSKTPYIILTHQDVSFSDDLLSRIEDSMKAVNYEFGAFGMVGVDKNRNYRWSTEGTLFELDTVDCCFLVTRTDNNIEFDTKNFDEFHLYVEDYCAQLNRKERKSIYTISIDSQESNPQYIHKESKKSFLNHHSYTVSKRGSCWGRYIEYRMRLEQKWPNIKTT